MAKWKTVEQAFDGAIRVVNYVDGTQRAKDIFGNEGPEMPVMKYRIEQLGPWGWQPVPVYHEEADGTLTEIPQ
jgi:hypothetical protein